MKKNIKDFLWNITHPSIIYKIKDKFYEFKWKCQRFKRGYADVDVWNINDWFARMIPNMLKEMEKDRMGHPQNLTDRQWTKVITKMANLFEQWDDDKCIKKNKYEEELDKAYDEFHKNYPNIDVLKTEEELADEKENNVYYYKGLRDTPEYKALWDKWYKEQNKIDKYQEKCVKEALTLFSKYFFDLWD